MNAMNKLVSFVANPLFVGMMIVLAGLILAVLRRRKGVIWLSAISFAWFWFWSMPIIRYQKMLRTIRMFRGLSFLHR